MTALGVMFELPRCSSDVAGHGDHVHQLGILPGGDPDLLMRDGLTVEPVVDRR